MKATGIVRRIDDLGRVVIPKEIRRQMRIREGDPLEIYTETNGTVCFRKYSPIGTVDLDTMKLVCDKGLGRLNYTVFDRDGDSIMPKGIKAFDVDEDLPENTCIIRSDGDIIGYLQSPSGNREVVASIIGGLLEN